MIVYHNTPTRITRHHRWIQERLWLGFSLFYIAKKLKVGIFDLRAKYEEQKKTEEEQRFIITYHRNLIKTAMNNKHQPQPSAYVERWFQIDKGALSKHLNIC